MAIIRRYLNTSFTYGGTGADGSLHYDGVSPVAHATLSGSTYTLTGNTNSTDVLIDSGVTVNPDGYEQFCTGTYTNNGTVDASGSNGTNGGTPTPGNPGADATHGGTLPALTTRMGTASAGNGGTEAVNGGGDGGNGSNAGCGTGGSSGGGSWSLDPSSPYNFANQARGGDPGSGGNPSRFSSPTNIPDFVDKLFNTPSALSTLGITTIGANGGGGGGGGSSAWAVSGHAAGGGGGGRGGNGEWVAIFANAFAGSGLYKSKGGNGGNGGNGNSAIVIGSTAAEGGGGPGGGGAGGCGGLIALVSATMPRVATNVSGGNGGSAGIPGLGASGPDAHGDPGGIVSYVVNGIDGIAILVSTGARPRKQVAFLLGLGATNVPIPPPVPAPDDCVEDPQIMVRWSNDGGHSYGTELSQSIGKAGEYNKRVRFNRLGRARDRVYEVKVTDAVKVRFISAFLDIDEGTN